MLLPDIELFLNTAIAPNIVGTVSSARMPPNPFSSVTEPEEYRENLSSCLLWTLVSLNDLSYKYQALSLEKNSYIRKKTEKFIVIKHPKYSPLRKILEDTIHLFKEKTEISFEFSEMEDYSDDESDINIVLFGGWSLASVMPEPGYTLRSLCDERRPEKRDVKSSLSLFRYFRRDDNGQIIRDEAFWAANRDTALFTPFSRDVQVEGLIHGTNNSPSIDLAACLINIRPFLRSDKDAPSILARLGRNISDYDNYGKRAAELVAECLFRSMGFPGHNNRPDNILVPSSLEGQDTGRLSDFAGWALQVMYQCPLQGGENRKQAQAILIEAANNAHPCILKAPRAMPTASDAERR